MVIPFHDTQARPHSWRPLWLLALAAAGFLLWRIVRRR